MSRSIVHLVRVIGLVALTLVLAHEAVFLARYGSIYGEALQHAGHGAAWSDAVIVVLLGGALVLAGTLAGLYRLGRQLARRASATRVRAATVERAELLGIARRWLGTSIAVAASSLVLLTIQENLEHIAAGLGAPGVAILLSPEYPFAVLITLAAALGVAFAATLLAWRRAVLVRRLRTLAAEDHETAARPTPAPAAEAVPHRGSILARRLGRRAPPVLLAA